jgi:hypothetical protein
MVAGRDASSRCGSRQEPTGEINLTDPDSRHMLAARGFVQGYNAQAAVNEQHVVIHPSGSIS